MNTLKQGVEGAVIIHLAGGQQVAVHRASFQLAGARGEGSGLARGGRGPFQAHQVILLEHIRVLWGSSRTLGQEFHEMRGTFKGSEVHLVVHAMVVPGGRGGLREGPSSR